MKRKLPRAVKTILWAAVILLCVYGVYIVMGMPNLSPEHAFRRAERAQLVGPGEIIGEVEVEGWQVDRLIVGKTDYNYELFTYSSDGFWDGIDYFYYYAITGDMKLFAVPGCFLNYGVEYMRPKSPMYLILFDLQPKAQRAELTYACDGRTYTARSERENDSFFLFEFSPESEQLVEDLYVLWWVASSGTYNSDPMLTEIVTIRLYDETGALLLERELTVGDNTVA